jgi:hypothetical protein
MVLMIIGARGLSSREGFAGPLPKAIDIEHVFAEHIGHVNKVFQFETWIRKFLEIRCIVFVNGNPGR